MKITKKRIKRVKRESIAQASQEELGRRESNMEEGAVKKVVQSLRVIKNRPLARARKGVVGTKGSQASMARAESPYEQGWKAAGKQIKRITGEDPRSPSTPPANEDYKEAEDKAKAKVIKRVKGKGLTPTQVGKRVGKATYWAGKEAIRRSK